MTPQMTGISLNGLDISPEEKASWEKELLGVSLSHNPLIVLAAADVGDAINSIDQLDEDMQGLAYTLVGNVSSMAERYTREQKKFLVVNFELLGGPVEVIVWPDVLERTAGLWGEGKLLSATGKLRLRGDGYSLACDQVAVFTPPQLQDGETPAAPGPVIQGDQLLRLPSLIRRRAATATAQEPPARSGGYSSGNGNGSRHQSNGSYRTRPNGNGNGSGKGPGNGYGEGASTGGGATVSVANARTVFVGISESDDPMEDAHLLREVISLLLEYPGKDRVNLEIYTGGRRVVLDLPVVSTGYCEDLKGRLEQMLGSNSVLLQGSDGPDVEDVPF